MQNTQKSYNPGLYRQLGFMSNPFRGKEFKQISEIPILHEHKKRGDPKNEPPLSDLLNDTKVYAEIPVTLTLVYSRLKPFFSLESFLLLFL